MSVKPIFSLIFSWCCLSSFAQKKISIDSVNYHKNEMVTVCGKVYETKFSEESQTTFIDLGGAYPNALLTVVIFGKDIANFKEAPEILYKDKNICVTGVIKEYKTKDEIIVSKPEEIVVE